MHTSTVGNMAIRFSEEENRDAHCTSNFHNYMDPRHDCKAVPRLKLQEANDKNRIELLVIHLLSSGVVGHRFAPIFGIDDVLHVVNSSCSMRKQSFHYSLFPEIGISFHWRTIPWLKAKVRPNRIEPDRLIQNMPVSNASCSEVLSGH